nr:HAD family hydrolase [uncultured Caproiciproducens sp.]
MKYTHVVFDVDGTMLDSEDAVLLSLQKTLLTVQQKMYPLEELRFTLGIPGIDALTQMKVDHIEDAFRLWGDTELEYSYAMKLFDGITSTLLQLEEDGISLGIITSRTREEFDDTFSPLGLNHYFEYIICAEDSAEHKPNPGPMLKYLELSEAHGKDVLYIGDSVYDCNCAKGAGVDFALALWGCRAPEGISPDYALGKPQEILSL